MTRGRQRCPYCEREGKRAYLSQVPFVAMCQNGHLQDFPWREWLPAEGRAYAVGAVPFAA